MFNFIFYQYGISVINEISLGNGVYKVKADKGIFIVKEVNDDTLDNIYLRMNLSHIKSFNIPLRGKNDKYVQIENDRYYILMNYYVDESLLGYDLKLSFIIKEIATLHKKTYIELNSSDNYLESTLNYLDNEVKKINDALESRMEVVERNDYHSPNDWYFMLHFKEMQMCLEEASRHILEFENQVKDKKSLRICLIYQNFDFSHIILKQERIISTEKIGFNFAPYDLYNIISNVKINSLNMRNYMNEYLKINPLQEYEKHYLMALLYIFSYHRFQENIKDLTHLIGIVNYLNMVKSIQDEIIFSSSLEE